MKIMKKFFKYLVQALTKHMFCGIILTERGGDMVESNSQSLATAVSNTFLLLANKDGISDLSNLKMQKLLYFTNRAYLQTTGTPLFEEKFSRWPYGPVLPSIYNRFRQYGSEPISSLIQNPDGSSYKINLSEDDPVAITIIETWELYKKYSALQLSQLTHQKGSAWSKAQPFSELKDEDILEEEDYGG
jgi:uncharacterized phage-associated protein